MKYGQSDYMSGESGESAFGKLKNTKQPRSLILTLTALDFIKYRMKQAQLAYPLKTIYYDIRTDEVYIEEVDENSWKSNPNINGCWGEGLGYTNTIRKVIN